MLMTHMHKKYHTRNLISVDHIIGTGIYPLKFPEDTRLWYTLKIITVISNTLNAVNGKILVRNMNVVRLQREKIDLLYKK